ncbi:MAG: tRNA (N6-threonylcarbamoyladenosine(37)-N6)-methyltransferase TrmO, partial [Lentisphaeraceae bacterium]|nr:tRNA (N6-threonylcarbamoyladenosine(37)-N6)-methyltransferase TrmO [Lentisphaeraceae bacterium]
MFQFDPIGYIKSDFVEKFGIPRQPGLSPNSEAAIVMERNQFNEEALRDLDGNSHIWLIFVFNSLKKTPDKARIRPPRLGGNKFVGVYSSRSPYRPNPIGLSLVKLNGISIEENEIKVHIKNHDLVDKTPILDI